jgi:hypothetical protein
MRQHDQGEDRQGHNRQQGVIGDGAGQQETLVASEITPDTNQKTAGLADEQRGIAPHLHGREKESAE